MSRLELTGFGVALEAKHDFRRAVPSRGDVLGHVTSVFLRINRKAAGKTKVTNLELTVGIDEEVARLEISVEDIGGVDVLEAAEDLVDERLEVSIG